MNCKSTLALVCSLLLVYAPLVEAANSRGMGMLTTAGTTQVNGVVAPTGTTIFAGDRVINAEGANAAVSISGGSRLILIASGSLQMSEADGHPTARLEKGSLAVLNHAAAPVAVEAAGTRITGAANDSVYAVTVDGNDLRVVASKGNAEVEGAGRTVEVPEGKTLVAKMMAPDPPGPQETPQTGAPPAASGGGAGRFLNFKNVLLMVTAAGALAGLAIAVKDLTRTCKVNTSTSPFSVNCD